MNETYDVVVCGTGLIECILSGLLSQEGTVYHIQARRCCTLIAMLTMEERVLQSTSQIYGRYFETKKSQTKNWVTTEIGILILFLNTSCMEENLSKFY